MKKLFSVIDEVEKLLTKYPPLRDSDERLMANIWWMAIPNLGDVNGKDILSMLAKRELPSYESVSRCRRKIQEMHPSLRGNKWEDRHKRAERSEEHTSELQSRRNLVCRLLLEKKKDSVG